MQPLDDVENNEPTTQLGGITGKGFMPGQSGNPGGRPKKKPVTELYEELLQDPEFKGDLRGALKKALIKGGMAGMFLTKEMTDRVEGKVPSNVNVHGELNVTVSERLAAARARKAKK